MITGKKFSADFTQATEVNAQTRVLVQTPENPVQYAELGQFKEVVNEGMVSEDSLSETLNNTLANYDTAEQSDEKLQTALAGYAKQDGNYPKMSVGFAENIVGDKSATEEEFSFRPTAGVNRNTLNDGAARIHSIKGRSVVANQKAQVLTNTITQNGISATNDGVKSTIIGTAEANTNISLANALIPANHKCLFKGCPANGSVDTFFLFITDKDNKIDTGKGVLFTNTNNDTIWLNLTVKQGTTVDLVIYPVLYDLTKMFGADNEPTTVEEFYQRMPIGVDTNAYNAGEIVDGNYGAIKTVGFNAFNGTYAKVLGGVQYYFGGNYTSIGFTTDEGGTTEAITVPTSPEVVGGSAPEDRLYTPSQNGYIYATGENICISLYWPTEYGNLYGAYQPYKPFVRDLGDIIAQYFTDGVMRSAGSAHDEIRWNSTKQKWEAVTRIGEVDLGTINWNYKPVNETYPYGFFYSSLGEDLNDMKIGSDILCARYSKGSFQTDKSIVSNASTSMIYVIDSSYTTDTTSFKEAMQGVMLYYELAKPDIEPITENVNLDYDVSDYGTEELIVADGEQSAPLVADIEYSPNVLAVLKNAPDIANDVDTLKSQVAALTAQLAALTTANTNE